MLGSGQKNGTFHIKVISFRVGGGAKNLTPRERTTKRKKKFLAIRKDVANQKIFSQREEKGGMVEGLETNEKEHKSKEVKSHRGVGRTGTPVVELEKELKYNKLFALSHAEGLRERAHTGE